MNLKFFILILAFSSVFFSSCSRTANQSSSEVVITNKSSSSSNEVTISNADFKKDNKPVSTQKESQELPKRTLADKSEVETLVDGFGNKTETRYFVGNSRLRMLIARTSPDGSTEVTVYGNGGDTRVVPGLGDIAMTATGDEIANAAKLTQTTPGAGERNFMKNRRSLAQ